LKFNIESGEFQNLCLINNSQTTKSKKPSVNVQFFVNSFRKPTGWFFEVFQKPRNWMDGGGSFSFKKIKIYLFFSNACKPKLL
jgi:hypothetical protein